VPELIRQMEHRVTAKVSATGKPKPPPVPAQSKPITESVSE
jgi:hypothetical protein